MTRLEAWSVRIGAALSAVWFGMWCAGHPQPVVAYAAVIALTVAAVCDWRTDDPDHIEERRRASEATYSDQGKP